MNCYDEQGTLVVSRGKLCTVCGGSGLILKPTKQKTISYGDCPGLKYEGKTCKQGILLTLYQDPSTPYFEEMHTGYRPAWAQSGYTRADYLRIKNQWKDIPKYVPEKSVDDTNSDKNNPYKLTMEEILGLRVAQQGNSMDTFGKIYWKFIDAVEWPFKAIHRQYNRLFGINGSVRKWIEPKIGTTVRFKTNPATYSADRIVTNKYVDALRNQKVIKLMGGAHHVDDTKWWSIQIQTSRHSIFDVTWRAGVGWRANRWKTDNKGHFLKVEPLIWRIKDGKEKHWPAPVWETMH